MSVFLRHSPNMAPLYDRPSILPGGEASLTGLVIHASLLRGQLITSSKIQSKDGKTLAPELWLKVAEELTLADDEEWIFVICDEISIENTNTNGTGKVLTCYQATPKEGWKFGSFDCSAEAKRAQYWLNEPSKYPDIWAIDRTKKYVIELQEAGTNVKPCVYERPLVPDIIARIENGKCKVCLGERYICPGCPAGAHWLARRFDAFVEWRIPDYELDMHLMPFDGIRPRLVCPLCIGLDKMIEDKTWLNFFPRGELTIVGDQRAKKCNKWFEDLGYDFRFEIHGTGEKDDKGGENLLSDGDNDHESDNTVV
ncbi:hypothetical protein TWF506_005418 [Arthrobotrys conoides]|uniref:Uncharacterized protein n=1 Tax=Arthrobotrys conoides TaxID=74498 RepID=A0AAN8PPR4_9PEZI